MPTDKILEPIIIDCFAGGGGASEGINWALGRHVSIAINHDESAILMHKTNHPDTVHLTEDIFEVDLQKYVKGRPVALMWASPDCRHFSCAKGSAPKSDSVRMLPWAVHKHASTLKPEVIIMENVAEIQSWGPLDEKCRPIPSEKGKEYEKFITAMKSLGYKFECRELVAADYGAPTTRKRWYAIFRNDGREIKWPTPTHNEFGTNDLKKWLPCGDYIDWSDLGSSIFDRKKPLAENTQRRIANGIKKFIIDNPHPYIVKDEKAIAYLIQYHSEQKEGDSRGGTLDKPIQTIDTSNRYGLVTAFLSKFYKTGVGHGCDKPCHTITTSPGHFGLVSASLVKYYGNGENAVSLEEPLPTITTKDRFAMVSAFLVSYYGRDDAIWPVDYPVGTVTTHDRYGLVGVQVTIDGEKYLIADIFLRMLKPSELKLMQGFPEDYIIDRDYRWRPYPKTEQVAKIGNSVVPMMAKALVEANCPYLKEGERKHRINVSEGENGQMYMWA